MELRWIPPSKKCSIIFQNQFVELSPWMKRQRSMKEIVKASLINWIFWSLCSVRLGTQKISLTGSGIKLFKVLDKALSNAKELIERCGAKGNKIYRVLRRQQYMSKFKTFLSEICRVLNELPYYSSHIPAQTWIQVELLGIDSQKADSGPMQCRNTCWRHYEMLKF